MKKKKDEISNSLLECIEAVNVSSAAFDDLRAYEKWLVGLRETASKQTHYHRLSEWSDKSYGYIHKMLDKYGFINGGKDQNSDAGFWWKVYGLLGSVCYSPHLRTRVAPHHSSAWERNEAMITDINILIKTIATNEINN